MLILFAFGRKGVSFGIELMRRLFIITFLLPLTLAAQNLLMNGDFEDENICSEFSKNCAPEGWICSSLRSNYYFDDAVHAYKGQHFTGLIYRSVASERGGRYRLPGFLRSRLLCRLRKGASYELSFYLWSKHPFTDSIGIYFSSDDVLFRKEGLRNARPVAYVRDITKSGEKNEWQHCSLNYVATGEENFIVVSDFARTAHSIGGMPDLAEDYYFFFDDISLKPLNPLESICADFEVVREEEYATNERHNVLEKNVYRYTKYPPEIKPGTVTVVQIVDTLIIPDVLFETNSFHLSARANALLDSFLISIETERLDSVIVEGHTDSTGSRSHNIELSNNRARAVGNYLLKTVSKPIIARGCESLKPADTNKTPAGRQHNRRVELFLYLKE